MKAELKEQAGKQGARVGEYGIATEAGTVRLERVLPGPIERVWAYLTESEKRGKWFASGPMELRSGGKLGSIFTTPTCPLTLNCHPSATKIVRV